MTKRRPKISPPLTIERDYQKDLRGFIIASKKIIDNRIIPFLPTIFAEAEALRPTNDSERFDQDISKKIKDLFTATQIEIDSEITDREISRTAERKAEQVSNWNREKVKLMLRDEFGIDVFSEPWLAQELNNFVERNVNLIKSNNTAFLNQVEDVVFDGVRRGLRQEEIAKRILGTGKTELGVSRFRKAKTRANLIARDQVNKLNGQLTRLRQMSLGVKSYIWKTVTDPRVRDSHAALHDREFTWKTGAGGIHPGDEIQCRCYAQPVMTDLLE